MKAHPTRAEVDDLAIAWLAERDDGFSPARAREFAQWVRADSRHAAAVARMEQTLGLLGELPEFRAELNTAFDRAATVVPFSPAAGAAMSRQRSRRTRWLGGLGFAAVLALATLAAWRLQPRPEDVHYATTASGYQRARLADGSMVELNSASAIRVQFSAAERHVSIESGEAHFNVSPDTTRPFVVNAGDVFVRAVGTSFSVRFARDGAVEVIVTEGTVRVGRGDSHDPAGAAAAPLVAGGERLVMPTHAPLPRVEKVPPEAMRLALAWREPLAEFADVPLADVVARFNGRNRVQLVIESGELGRRLIGGTFAVDEAEAFVRLLERDGEIVGERRGENEILLRRAR